jgi:hypothetical protein
MLFAFVIAMHMLEHVARSSVCTTLSAGNYIFDSATMGASLYRMFFFSQDSTLQDIDDVRQSSDFADTSLLYKHQRDIDGSTTYTSGTGMTTKYSYTNVERIGEFNTGGPSADNIESETCAIGATIAPQVRL